MLYRCGNKTRNNKKSGKCKLYTDFKKRKSIKNRKKCSKGVNIPQYHINNIIDFEKHRDETTGTGGMFKKPEFYDKMKQHLQQLCLPKELQTKHKWHTIDSYLIALDKSIVT
jgi:hypothetical protein